MSDPSRPKLAAMLTEPLVCVSLRSSRLQCAANDLFRRLHRRIDGLQKASHFDGFVAERDECAERFGLRASLRLEGVDDRGHTGKMTKVLDPILHFDQQTFSRLTTNARDANERVGVLRFNAHQ